jgi:hypothetical protein
MGQNAILTKISLFFLKYSYKVKPLDLQLKPPALSIYTLLIKQVNELIWKL